MTDTSLAATNEVTSAARTTSQRNQWIATGVIFALMLAAPLLLSDFRLSLLGKFLAYAILALGLDLIWGYTGILSLGHGVYFGLGAYCMAMYLKLEAAQSQGLKLPDFMTLYGDVKILPFWWAPFKYAWFAIPAAIIVPALLAALLGYFTFRNRIKGVFFSILSQALSIVMVTLFVGQIAYTAGTNGLTDFQTIFGHDINADSTRRGFYFATVIALALTYLFCRYIVGGRFGKVLVAIRDGENRVRFTGYNPVAYKVFIYAVSAGLAGLAGVLFVLQVGIIAPAQMGIIPSIQIVLWVAIGGRGTLVGAVLGALLVNSAENAFSESYPATWSYLMGGMFLMSVLYLPDGVIGWAKAMQAKWQERRQNHDARNRAAISGIGSVEAGQSSVG
ncbi:MAG TPA: urea ABC transporter permease subunit UrtC [Abditibacteriaceae bacterium]|jgi:urea transport system permease protein